MCPENDTNDSTDSIFEPTRHESVVEHIVGVRLPVEIGNFHLHLYTDIEGKEHVALMKGELRGKENVLTRIHSECLTGDLFGSMRCDCGPQLKQSMKIIQEEGEGLVIYLRQEGRGIGLAEKLKAYNLQDQGFDTVDANLKLGHRGEERDYEVAAHILRDQGIESIRLLSNNPDKVTSLNDHGITVASLIPLHPPVTDENYRYLETKVSRMDHRIDFNHLSPSTPEREEILRYVKRNLEEARVRRSTSDGTASDGGNQEKDLFITLSYFQGLEGCVSTIDPGSFGGMRENLLLKGQLRQHHGAFLTGKDSYLSLGPPLQALFPDGFDSLPIILDEELALPPDSFPERLGDPDQPLKALILTTKKAKKQCGERFDSRDILLLPFLDEDYQIELSELKRNLLSHGITSLVVEDPQEVISTLLNNREADLIVSTVLPCFFGSGTECSGSHGPENLKGDYCMDGFRFNKLSGELVYYGLPDWKDS